MTTPQTILALFLALSAASCTIADSGPPPAARDTSAAALIEARVPEAAAGDSGWQYVRRAQADLSGDGRAEEVVVLADAALDLRGEPLWEDGHRWQVYVQDASGERTRVYARFLPNGALEVRLGAGVRGAPPRLVLLERTPFSLGLYELRYVAPGRAVLEAQLVRQLSANQPFQGAPEP